MPTLPELLASTVELDGSDLHITTNSPPQVRVDGVLRALELPQLGAAETKQLVYSVLTDRQKKQFEETHELDFSFGIRGIARFRCNVFSQRRAVAAVYRVIPDAIRGLKDLGLPPIVERLAERPRGLVLVTGPTGSGKSTTLAALIDRINERRHGHILTIEDPIEYLHTHKNCLVNQREVHSDTEGFGPALRAALREDPDVVLIGELRDLETIEAALRIAETGHLTFATAHTNSAYQTINRLVDVFPDSQQAQIRTQLSLVLEGIMCQSLLPKQSGSGRAVAIEVDLPSTPVWFEADEGQMRQVVWNLATNGIRAMPDGGNLVVGVQCEDSGSVALRVRDEGVGIPPDELDNMLQPFQGRFAYDGVRAASCPGDDTFGAGLEHDGPGAYDADRHDH